MSNLLLIPKAETLHQSLTFDDIDLSEKKFNTKSHTRAKLLEFLGEKLEANPNVLSYFFTRHGTTACLVVTYLDGKTFATWFKLYSSTVYSNTDSSWTKQSFRDYLAHMLAQKSTTTQIDYLHTKFFVFL